MTLNKQINIGHILDIYCITLYVGACVPSDIKTSVECGNFNLIMAYDPRYIMYLHIWIVYVAQLLVRVLTCAKLFDGCLF